MTAARKKKDDDLPEGLSRLPSGRIRAKYRDQDRNWHSKSWEPNPRSGPSGKTLAKKWYAAQRTAVDAGVHVAPNVATTVTEYAKAWAAGRPHRDSTARRVESLIDTHIDGTDLGRLRLNQVRPSMVQAWVTDRSKVLAPSTLRTLVSLLRSVFTSAALDRLVPTSPVVRIQMPPNERPRVIPLTIAQVAVLADVMPARNRAMVLTQAGLGLRIGELLALRASDVNFLGRAVRIATQIAPGSKTRSEPKTPRSKRTLPLPQMVAEALATHMAEFPPAADGSLFSTRTGAVYRHDYYGSLIFKAAVRKAGLPESITSHDLRHHYASVLLDARETEITVAERLGHQNTNLVRSTYGHIMPDREEGTRRAIDAAWSAERVTDESQERPTRP